MKKSKKILKCTGDPRGGGRGEEKRSNSFGIAAERYFII